MWQLFRKDSRRRVMTPPQMLNTSHTTALYLPHTLQHPSTHHHRRCSRYNNPPLLSGCSEAPIIASRASTQTFVNVAASVLLSDGQNHTHYCAVKHGEKWDMATSIWRQVRHGDKYMTTSEAWRQVRQADKCMATIQAWR